MQSISSIFAQGMEAERDHGGARHSSETSLYVAQIPICPRWEPLPAARRNADNLAAVKAQVDYIQSRFKSAVKPSVIVHEHCGGSGSDRRGA